VTERSRGLRGHLGPEAGPLEARVRELLGRGQDAYPHGASPLEEAILILAAELDHRAGSVRSVNPAAASRLGRPPPQMD